MAWQDLFLTAAQVVFLVALLPSALGPDKPAIATSLMTGTVLVGIVVVYVTLDYWFSATMVALTAGLWFLMAVQKVRRDGWAR